jgi:predicted methyltransferase
MKTSTQVSAWLMVTVLLLGSACTQEQGGGLQSRLQAAMSAADRPADDKAIDADRKPAEVLAFFGIDEGMSVLEVVAAGGYYTELLSAAVGPSGTVYMQNDEGTLSRGDGAAEKAIVARLAGNRLPNVRRINADIGATGLNGEADAAVIVLELHDPYNFGGREAALAMLRSVYAALKPGGTLGLVEHAGNAGVDNRQLHRIDKAVALDLLREAGFEIEAESDLLANPADDHSLIVFDPSLRRKTDRFIVRARRPGG